MAPTALITGGSSGIGKAIGLELYARQWNIVIASKSVHTLSKAARSFQLISSTGSFHAFQCDVSSEQSVHNLVQSFFSLHQQLDLFIASAAIAKGLGSSRVFPHATATLPLHEWREIISTNLTGIFLTNKAVAKSMIHQGSGQILNICSSTSRHGLRGQPYAPAYCSSKYAVLGFTESLALEVSPYGVTVQSIFPGPVSTPLINDTALASLFDNKCITPSSLASSIADIYPLNTSVNILRPHFLPL